MGMEDKEHVDWSFDEPGDGDVEENEDSIEAGSSALEALAFGDEGDNEDPGVGGDALPATAAANEDAVVEPVVENEMEAGGIETVSQPAGGEEEETWVSAMDGDGLSDEDQRAPDLSDAGLAPAGGAVIPEEEDDEEEDAVAAAAARRDPVEDEDDEDDEKDAAATTTFPFPGVLDDKEERVDKQSFDAVFDAAEKEAEKEEEDEDEEEKTDAASHLLASSPPKDEAAGAAPAAGSKDEEDEEEDEDEEEEDDEEDEEEAEPAETAAGWNEDDLDAEGDDEEAEDGREGLLGRLASVGESLGGRFSKQTLTTAGLGIGVGAFLISVVSLAWWSWPLNVAERERQAVIEAQLSFELPPPVERPLAAAGTGSLYPDAYAVEDTDLNSGAGAQAGGGIEDDPWEMDPVTAIPQPGSVRPMPAPGPVVNLPAPLPPQAQPAMPDGPVVAESREEAEARMAAAMLQALLQNGLLGQSDKSDETDIDTERVAGLEQGVLQLNQRLDVIASQMQQLVAVQRQFTQQQARAQREAREAREAASGFAGTVAKSRGEAPVCPSGYREFIDDLGVPLQVAVYGNPSGRRWIRMVSSRMRQSLSPGDFPAWRPAAGPDSGGFRRCVCAGQSSQ